MESAIALPLRVRRNGHTWMVAKPSSWSMASVRSGTPFQAFQRHAFRCAQLRRAMRSTAVLVRCQLLGLLLRSHPGLDGVDVALGVGHVLPACRALSGHSAGA